MPKFKVHVCRTGYRHANVEVEAEDTRAACAVAAKKIDEGGVEIGEEKDCETEIQGVTGEDRDVLLKQNRK